MHVRHILSPPRGSPGTRQAPLIPVRKTAIAYKIDTQGFYTLFPYIVTPLLYDVRRHIAPLIPVRKTTIACKIDTQGVYTPFPYIVMPLLYDVRRHIAPLTHVQKTAIACKIDTQGFYTPFPYIVTPLLYEVFLVPSFDTEGKRKSWLGVIHPPVVFFFSVKSPLDIKTPPRRVKLAVTFDCEQKEAIHPIFSRKNRPQME
ncbi:hypothetical protein AVEN_39889-1 [Araneus ventricosus]|uniref:Uncharacterized protein n=1 Tax=Araneus ventricosus TaxID=182803 RepID=A0A4Y2JQB1_ARAVE|nr:hypothetical protein AVEN_39889-1 [Araneus ventricosus]